LSQLGQYMQCTTCLAISQPRYRNIWCAACLPTISNRPHPLQYPPLGRI
jgi:hypothetical protein